jgi:hypothetical protein
LKRWRRKTHGLFASSAALKPLLHDCHKTMPFKVIVAFPSQQLRIICNDGGMMAPPDLTSDRSNGVYPDGEHRWFPSDKHDGQSAVMIGKTAVMFALDRLIR